jgi:integral membrane sensor domain MASE1
MTMSRALDTLQPAFGPDIPGEARARKVARPAGMAQSMVPVFTAMTVLVLVVLSLTFARSAGMVAALWGAAGVAVAVWLRTSRGPLYDLSFGGLIAAGIAAGNLLVGNSIALTVMFTAANMLEICLAVLLARRFAPTLNLASVEGACRFLLAAAIIAPIPAAVFAGGMLWWLTGADFLDSARMWWFGHGLSIAVLASFGLALTRREAARYRVPARAAEAVVLLGALAAVSYAVFFLQQMPIAFAPMPLLLLIAVRMRMPGVTAGLVIISVLAVGGSMQGLGPYAVAFEGADRALMAQLLVLLSADHAGCRPSGRTRPLCRPGPDGSGSGGEGVRGQVATARQRRPRNQEPGWRSHRYRRTLEDRPARAGFDHPGRDGRHAGQDRPAGRGPRP